MMEEEGTSTKDAKKRKKRSSTRRKITIKDFPLVEREEPYNMVEDVCSQGPKLTWPQLFHLFPKMLPKDAATMVKDGEYSHYKGNGLRRSQEG